MGLAVLVVEDEMTIAFLIEDMLLDLGHDVVGTAMRLDAAMEAARGLPLDFALLDVNLDGVMSFPVAEILAQRGVPFAFATGYGRAGIAEPWRDRAVLSKPFGREALAQAIAEATSGVAPH